MRAFLVPAHRSPDDLMRPTMRATATLFLLLALAGCGTKGPLYLPEPGQDPRAPQKPPADARR